MYIFFGFLTLTPLCRNTFMSSVPDTQPWFTSSRERECDSATERDLKTTFGLCSWTSCSDVLCPIVTGFLHRTGPSMATAETDKHIFQQIFCFRHNSHSVIGLTHMTKCCRSGIFPMTCSMGSIHERTAG